MVDIAQPIAKPVKHEGMCRSLISSQCGLFASGGDDGHVIVLENSGNQIAAFPTAPPTVREGYGFPWVCDMAFVGSGPQILVSNNKKRTGLWNARSGQFMSEISLDAEPPYDPFTKISVSLDGRFAAFGGRFGKRAYLWDLQQSKMVWRTISFSNELGQLLFIPSSDLVLVSTGTYKGEVALLNLQDGSVTSHSANRQYDVLSCTNRFGQAIVARYSSDAGHIEFLDPLAGRAVSISQTDSNGGADLCKGVFSKDGSLFAALPDEGPSDIWNVGTGQRMARLDAGHSYFEHAQFTDDNTGLVAWTNGGDHGSSECALWSMASSNISRSFKVSEKPSAIVTSGKFFVAGGSSGTVEMFHIN
jgi:WD40 repeat protein